MSYDLSGGRAVGYRTIFSRLTRCHVIQDTFHCSAMWQGTLKNIKFDLNPITTQFLGVNVKNYLYNHTTTLSYFFISPLALVCVEQ